MNQELISLKARNNLKAPIGIAFSGGIDSVALTYMLIQGGIACRDIYLLHYNHNWSEKSQEMEAFCRWWATKYDCQIICQTASMPGRTSEDDARKQRYTFLIDTAKKYNIQTICLAHHLDDQVETFLFRLVRGTGLSGAASMAESQIMSGIEIYRPLLSYQKDDIATYADQHDLMHYDDPTNTNTDITRNYIRHEIIPRLKHINPQAVSHIGGYIDICRGHKDYIESAILDQESNYTISYIAGQHLTLQRAIIKSILHKNQINQISYKLIESIREQIHLPETKINLSGGKYWVHKDDKIDIYEPTPLVDNDNYKFYMPLGVEEKRVIVAERGITIKQISKLPKNLKSSNPQYINLTCYAEQSLCIRTRQTGDTFQPYGLEYPVKLRKYLIDKKILNRDNLLYLAVANSNRILAIIGYEISYDIAVRDTVTHLISLDTKYN